MSKIYVFDHGWSGAEIMVAPDKETACKGLIDTSIAYYLKLAEEHDRLYDLQERPNPWWSHHASLVKNRESLLKEYDIVDGLRFDTDGDF